MFLTSSCYNVEIMLEKQIKIQKPYKEELFRVRECSLDLEFEIQEECVYCVIKY